MGIPLRSSRENRSIFPVLATTFRLQHSTLSAVTFTPSKTYHPCLPNSRLSSARNLREIHHPKLSLTESDQESVKVWRYNNQAQFEGSLDVWEPEDYTRILQKERQG
jgi:hypothetical protein